MSTLKVGDRIRITSKTLNRGALRGVISILSEVDRPNCAYAFKTLEGIPLDRDEFELVDGGPRTFSVYRTADISANHNSDTMNAPDEVQFFGVIFPSGKAVINWDTAAKSISVFDSLEDVWKIHGHAQDGYGTEVLWHDTGIREVLK